MSSGKKGKVKSYADVLASVDPATGIIYHGAQGDWKEAARTSQAAAPVADWEKWKQDPLRAAKVQGQRFGGTANWSPWTGYHQEGRRDEAFARLKGEDPGKVGGPGFAFSNESWYSQPISGSEANVGRDIELQKRLPQDSSGKKIGE